MKNIRAARPRPNSQGRDGAESNLELRPGERRGSDRMNRGCVSARASTWGVQCDMHGLSAQLRWRQSRRHGLDRRDRVAKTGHAARVMRPSPLASPAAGLRNPISQRIKREQITSRKQPIPHQST